MNKEIKEKLIIFLFILMIVLGLGMILFPLISNQVNKIQYQKVIGTYDDKIVQNSETENNQMLTEAREYNSSISTTDIIDVFQNPVQTNSTEYLSILNVDDNGMMGYISIPKIDVRIPIYHGTSSDILQKGVGHLEGSSFPVGGESTHAILSAHRGLPSSRLFTDLDQLEEGDIFYIYVLNEVLAYQVDQILVTEPSETEALKIVDGKDYVTLVTCTPYAINTHRLLVRGERIEYNKQVEEQTVEDRSLSTADIILYISLIIAILLIIIAVIVSVRHKKNKNRYTQINDNSTNVSIMPLESEVAETKVEALSNYQEQPNNVSTMPPKSEVAETKVEALSNYQNQPNNVSTIPLENEVAETKVEALSNYQNQPNNVSTIPPKSEVAETKVEVLSDYQDQPNNASAIPPKSEVAETEVELLFDNQDETDEDEII